MNRKKRLLILAWAALAASPCSGETVASILSAQNDPLTRQIIRKTTQEDNSGITAVVWTANGKPIKLEAVSLDVKPVSGVKDVKTAESKDAQAGLKIEKGLLAERAPSRGRKVKQASAQLRHVARDKQNWKQ